MPECGYGGDRANHHRKLLHLLEHLYSQQIAFEPGIQKTFGGMRRFRRNPAIEFFQQRTEFSLASSSHWTEQHPSSNTAEEFPPELAGRFKAFRTERLKLKSGAAQSRHRHLDGSASFRSDRGTPVVFKISNTHLFEGFGSGPAERNRCRRGIANVRPLHDFEEQLEVSHGSCHGPNYSQQRERPG